MRQFNHNLIKISFGLIFAILNIAIITNVKAASADLLVEKTNISRSENGLSKLSVNEKLKAAALAKGQDMFSKGYFAHFSPQGKAPWDFIKAQGYDYSYAGENLSIGYTSDDELQTAWMNSASHRENILGQNFNEIGIAIVNGVYQGENTTIVVEMFGKQAPAVINNITNLGKEVQSAQTAQSTLITNNMFTLYKDETEITPTSVFVGEEASLLVVVSGNVKQIIAKIGDEETNIMATDSITQDGDKKTFKKPVTLQREGNFDVMITIYGEENVATESFNMGKIAVSPKVIIKNEQKSNFALSKTQQGIIISTTLLLVIGLISFAILKQKLVIAQRNT